MSGDAPSPGFRVATYNVEDVRTFDVSHPGNPRLSELAATLQRLRPDLLLLNELAYDPAGLNARRFAENYLVRPQAAGLKSLAYRSFMAPVNTGLPSGHDLDRDGRVLSEPPLEPPPSPDGAPPELTGEGQLYGADCLGFGTFPGQYGMALLVSPEYEVLTGEVRTFRNFLWREMPGALLPTVPGTGEPWYSAAALDVLPLSSKSHWDVPVRAPDGRVIHLLASHPTPPGFDGPERRNAHRNHDEIRLWSDYLAGANAGANAEYLYDDAGTAGGLPPEASFILLGDLNADARPGGDRHSNTLGDPVGDFLFASGRIDREFVPRAPKPDPDLQPEDTALFGIRADYVLPSTDFVVVGGGVHGHTALFADSPRSGSPSDHFPVWLDLRPR